MDEYLHHVAGFFAQRADADAVFSRLVEAGLPHEQLKQFAAESAAAVPTPQASSNDVLKEVVVDGAIGTAVGTGLGVLAELALVAANVSLFVASPLIAPLAMLGWGASLGGFIGAAVGAGNKKGEFSALVGDAIASGQAVLVAETRTANETARAREIIEASVGDYRDISTV